MEIILAAFITFLGLCVGSFLNVVIYRLPHGESVCLGRSRCPVCGQTLAWYDLAPLFSYLALRRKCRYCRTGISRRYPLVELLTGVVFVGLYYHFGPTPVLAKYLFLVAVLIAVTFIDLDHCLIPNQLVLAGLIGGVISMPLAGDVRIQSALLGALIGSGFLLLVAIASKGGMGGGDVKLAAVTGFFLGWPLGPLGLYFGICLGGIAGIMLLLLGIKKRKDAIPFGPYIVLGTMVALLWGNRILGWYLQFFS